MTNQAIIASSIAIVALLLAQPGRAAEETFYEYRVMSLVEMFDGMPEAKKISEIVVNVSGALNRTDMDAADYEKALNRIAAQGWELVTVNKSNYWVFRRPAKKAGEQTR